MKNDAPIRIGLLRRLGRRARGEDRLPAHLHRLVREKRRDALAALRPAERAGRARVEDDDPEVGGDALERGAERRVWQPLSLQPEAVLVGVAGEVEHQLEVLHRASLGGQLLCPHRRSPRAAGSPRGPRACARPPASRHRAASSPSRTRARRRSRDGAVRSACRRSNRPRASSGVGQHLTPRGRRRRHPNHQRELRAGIERASSSGTLSEGERLLVVPLREGKGSVVGAALGREPSGPRRAPARRRWARPR